MDAPTFGLVYLLSQARNLTLPVVILPVSVLRDCQVCLLCLAPGSSHAVKGE